MKLTRKLLTCFTLVLGLALLTGTAWAGFEDADALFITTDNTYSAYSLGTIQVASPDILSKDLATFGADTMGFVIEAGGQKKILIREYNGGSAPDTVYLYPGEDWSGPIANTTMGDDILEAEAKGNYLYIANWGDTGSGRSGSVQQYDLQDLLGNPASMDAVETIPFDDGDAFTDQAKDFRIVGDYLYAVVTDMNSSYEHDNGHLYKISIPDMEVVDSMDVGKNPGGALNKAVMAEYNSALYIACMGGGYGGVLEPTLIKVDLDTFTATTIDDGTALPETYGYCGIAIADDGTVLLNAGSTDWMATTKLYRTTVTELDSGPLASTFWEGKDVDTSSIFGGMGIGFGGTLFYNVATERFWVEGGYAVITVDKEGNLLQSHLATKADLGGNAYDILPADGLSYSGEILLGGGGSGGGCNINGFAPAGLLLLTPLISILRKK